MVRNRTEGLTLFSLWGPFLWSVGLSALFASIASYFFENLLVLTPEENVYRHRLLLFTTICWIVGAGFVHVYLLRHAFLYIRSSRKESFSKTFLQEVWLQFMNYPARYSLVVFLCLVLGIALVVTFAISVPFVITSIPAEEYVLHIFLRTTVLTLPLTVLGFLILEQRMRRLVAILLQKAAAHVDLEDARVISISLQTKLLLTLIVTVVCSGTVIWSAFQRHVTEGQSSLWTLEFLAVALGIFVYTIVVGLLLSRTILRPAVFINQSIEAMLRHRPIPLDRLEREMPNSTDEVRQLYLNFLRRTRILEGMMLQLRTTGDRIFSETQKIFTAAGVQGQSVTVQASSLTEISASIDEMTRSVERISGDIEGLNKAASETMDAVRLGAEKMNGILVGIERLHTEADSNARRFLDLSHRMSKIEDVIQIINYVTHHTKILAFNAAIETQTAGEASERFGVVAAEIRRFAQEIASSTEEIRTIIGDMRKGIHSTVLASERELKLVSQTRTGALEAQQAFEDMTLLASDMTSAIEHISEAIEQQKLAHEQARLSIQQIDRVARDLLEKNHLILAPAQILNGLSQEVEKSIGL